MRATKEIVRPVTKCLPASTELWENTNLPLGCVITPFAGGSCVESPLPLTCIPKCLKCGAPHPSKASYYSTGSTDFVCKLCLKKSSGRYEDQAEQRPNEFMHPHIYGQQQQQQRVNEYQDTTLLFPKDTHEFSLPIFPDHYGQLEKLPAMTCPPLWCIIVDGTTRSRSYWNAIETSLSCALESDIPPHVHVALFVAYRHSLGVWDLTSPVPHVQHYQYPLKTNASGEGEYGPLLFELPLVPADVRHRSHIEAALRALTDTTVTTQHDHTVRGDSAALGAPLGVAIETILESLNGLGAMHPGQSQFRSRSDLPKGIESGLTYAGGRIMCFLSGPPGEMQTTTFGVRGRTGSGGFGGSCAESGLRFGIQDRNDTEEGGDENNGAFTGKSGFETYFNQLGHSCSEAALAVDVLLLKTEEDSLDCINSVPHLRYLADRSGAPGPLLFSFEEDIDNMALELLKCEVVSRTPWHRPMAYGSFLRVRVSEGLGIDSALLGESAIDSQMQMASLYQSGGLMGPATLANRPLTATGHNWQELWQMGACDDTSTVAIDLEVLGRIKDWVYLENYGDVLFKPCLQVSFAYTAVIDGGKEGSITVRRLRVTTVVLPVAHDTEILYSNLDPEALAVVLYHKLAMASLTDDLRAAREIGLKWLIDLLVCTYRSAETYVKRKEALNVNSFNHDGDSNFFPNERLLDRDGELSERDVLLAQGHERLCALPLLVYSLLQSDAFRRSCGAFFPSTDSRIAASAQMSSMTPPVLVRCIAPKLEIWSNTGDVQELLIDNIDLNMEALKLSILECQASASTDKLVILLDSPWQIMVCGSECIIKPTSPTVLPKISIGATIKKRAEQARSSYRVPPPILYTLDPATDGGSASLRISDALVEDSITFPGEKKFQYWSDKLANLVNEELMSDQ